MPIAPEPTANTELSELLRAFLAKTPGSKAHASRRNPVLTFPSLLQRLSFEMKEAVYPITVESAEGPRVRDVDGNEYIDLLMGFGVALFGHNPPFVLDAIREQLGRGMQIGVHDVHSGEAAALVCELTGMERVSFCNSGTEAVMLAARLSRAATGRDGVAYFTSSYHGHSDMTLFRASDDDGGTAPRWLGVPNRMSADTLVLEYGSARALEILEREGHRLAAVVVEPVQRANVALQPREFLAELRAITRRTGTKLVFDEVLTGFRLHPGGAQAWFDVRADIAAYGKVVGGGMPIGLVAGAAELMNFVDGGAWKYGDESGPHSFTTFAAGTFSKHPLTTAAAVAVLRHMKLQGVELCRTLNEATSGLVAHLNEDIERRGWPLRVDSCGSMFSIRGTDGFEFVAGPGSPADLLFYHLLLRGVYVSSQGPTYVLSTAHDPEVVAQVRHAMIESLAAVMKT